MRHLKTYEQNKFINDLFLNAYNKAIKHFTNLHEKITEEHVYEFIKHYISNYYGVHLPLTKDLVVYVKHLLHEKFLEINQKYNL